MSREDAQETEKSFARCADCGNEVAVLKTDDGELVRPHDECQECGGTTFTEVGPDELEDLSGFSEWAADGEVPDPDTTDSSTDDDSERTDTLEQTEADE